MLRTRVNRKPNDARRDGAATVNPPAAGEPSARHARAMELLRSAKALAQEYRAVTGKPLGITGEVAEYEAARLLGLELTVARQAGFDAIEKVAVTFLVGSRSRAAVSRMAARGASSSGRSTSRRSGMRC
jgi:hypothetical protein